MEALVLMVVLAVTVLVGTTLGGRYRVAPPILLIGLGAVLALAPPFSNVVLKPEVVLVLFLPAILYRESITLSLREIRANLPAISLLAVVLVGATMITVALAAVRIPAWSNSSNARPSRCQEAEAQARDSAAAPRVQTRGSGGLDRTIADHWLAAVLPNACRHVHPRLVH